MGVGKSEETLRARVVVAAARLEDDGMQFFWRRKHVGCEVLSRAEPRFFPPFRGRARSFSLAALLGTFCIAVRQLFSSLLCQQSIYITEHL
jgi:hypothetical protein